VDKRTGSFSSPDGQTPEAGRRRGCASSLQPGSSWTISEDEIRLVSRVLRDEILALFEQKT
jgi:hypothetical protein